MPLSDLPRIGQGMDLPQINDYLIMLGRRLNDFLNHLDTLNVDELDAAVIIANTITANKLNVSQLSAISANLGTITAGIIYGAFIATANGTYPRIELSSVGNLLAAYLDATHSMSIEPNIGGAPGIGFKDPSGLTGRIYGNSGIGMIALINNVELTSLSGFIDIKGTTLQFNSTDVMASINAKVSHGSTGSTAVSDNHNHGFTSSDYIQCYDSVGTPTVKKAWVPYAGSAGHSHTI